MIIQTIRAYHRLPTGKLLPRLQEMVEKARKTTLIKEKTLILGQYVDLHPFLEWLYKSGPLNLTSKALDRPKPAEAPVGSYEFLEDFLEDLSKRNITGHAALFAAHKLISEHSQHTDLIRCIIDKDLRIRMGSRLVLKSIGVASDNLPVALAENLSDERMRKHFRESLGRGEQWYVSRKLDGIRCLAFCRYSDGVWTVELKSRQGKPMDNLLATATAISASLGSSGWKYDLVLDGELCIFPNGIESPEDFRSVASVAGSDEADTSKLIFFVFDALTCEEFGGESRTPFDDRAERCRALGFTSTEVKILPQHKIQSVEELEQHESKWRENCWEGLMLRRAASPYLGRRSKDLLKFKDRQDSEFIVIGYSLAPLRFVDNGKEREEIMLSSIRVEHKGWPVDVGSGFTIQERRQLRELGDEIIGRRVTVSYFSESFRKGEGGDRPSLRFPSFKCFREHK